jgi:hypothetical protein
MRKREQYREAREVKESWTDEELAGAWRQKHGEGGVVVNVELLRWLIERATTSREARETLRVTFGPGDVPAEFRERYDALVGFRARTWKECAAQ